ncbi:MAG: hypothetical protein IKY98_02410 [Alphaproteobacteria bacterium]|nr:hypothetical protein [Alphaproteobacteria bacterium]
MKRLKYLHTFFRAHDIRPPVRLVAIPTSCCFDKPKEIVFSDDIEKNYLKTLAEQEGISLILPYDDNIFCRRWRTEENMSSYTHSPDERAMMLIEAICAKTFCGKYKYQAVCLSGGVGSIQVLEFVERYIRLNGPLPQRYNTLKVYGFDDALILLNYLGKMGVCTPVCYSRGLKGLIIDIRHTPLCFCVLKPCNASAQNIQTLSGHLITDMVWDSLVNKINLPDFIKKRSSFFVLSELDNQKQFDRCLFLAQSDKEVVFVISKDTPQKICQQFVLMIPPSVPVFCGAPFGHGDCLNKGQPITLFSKADLSCPTGVPVLSWDDDLDVRLVA